MIERIKHRFIAHKHRFTAHTKKCPPGCWYIYDHEYIGANGRQVATYFEFYCPCGCGMYGPIRIKAGVKEDHAWLWDGNRVSPTLSPSILCSGQPCKWHGFFENGGWRSNGDGAPTAPNCVHRIG